MHNADNYTLRNYGQMINDTARTEPFIEALRQAIVPGKSVVLDIGTSFGFFAFMACKLGAAKVFAVEPDYAIEAAKLCSENSSYSDRITWIRGLSTKIDLPEKVDVVVADLHGTLPFYNSNIASMIDARTRHLKPGGHIISMRDRLLAVPASAMEEYESVDAPWAHNPHDIDFSAARKFVVNDWWRARPDVVPGKNLLSAPRQWGEIDYRKVDNLNVDGDVEWDVERAGTLHGLYVWFDGDMAEGLGYSNAPTLPELVYGRAFFPMEHPVAVNVGDRISSRISAILIDGKYVYRWDTGICDSQGNSKARYKQSTFKSRPLNLKAVHNMAADNRLPLNESGQIAKVVIQSLSELKSLAEIANQLTEQFPKRFANATSALQHVSYLAGKFTDVLGE